MTILILSGADDDHAVHMRHFLSTQGHDAEFLDSRDFPLQMQLSYDPRVRDGEITLAIGRKLRIGDIRSVYWRCYGGIASTELPDEEQSYIAANDARSLFESMLIDLPCRWVNGWDAYQLHQTKAVAFNRVAALGVPVPATLLTNDAAAVRAFAEQHPDCIFKPVQGGAHTRRLTPEHLGEDHLANLAVAPVTLQEEIHGTNIRVFVAGQRVLACEIVSTDIDFRDDPDPCIKALDLPDNIAEQSLGIADALHLSWTGIDFRLTPEERYVFLEANPSPMFLGFEDRAGLPLTECLAALLAE